jgi:hypothetical protein
MATMNHTFLTLPAVKTKVKSSVTGEAKVAEHNQVNPPTASKYNLLLQA